MYNHVLQIKTSELEIPFQIYQNEFDFQSI